VAPTKKLIQTVELTEPLVPQEAKHLLVTGDNNANTIILHVEENGKPADLTGCAVVAYMIRPDGKKPTANGTVRGNIATVRLNEGFYTTPGRYKLFVRLTHPDGTKCTLLWLNGWAETEGNGEEIDTGGSGGGDDSGGGEVVATLSVDADGNGTLYGATLTVDDEGNAWIGGADVSGDGSGGATIG
jgi:hypothetical protein